MFSIVKSNVVKRALFVVAALSLAGAGCSSSGGGERAPEAVKAVDSMKAINDDLAKGDQQVDKVLAAIGQLEAGGGDLKPAYANFSSAFADLEASGERVHDRRESMRANRAAYIRKWQKELDTIDSAEVRAALAERKQKVSANYDRIGETVGDMRTDYRTFIKTLDGIERALALDLNPAGVAAMKGPMDTAKQQGAELKKSIAASRTELEAIIGRMATPAAAGKSS